MTFMEIFEDFKNGKLKDGDTFDYITNNTDCNPHIVRLNCNCNGKALTEQWIDFDGKAIRNCWSIFLSNIQDDIDYKKC